MQIILQSTRYQGSKRKLIPWMYSVFKNIHFDSVLDVFGGTGVVSYLFKQMGKNVTYNDFLEFNHQIGISLIENQSVTLNEKDINNILTGAKIINEESNFISTTFKNTYYKHNENIWLDNVVSNIHNLNSYEAQTLRYKKAIAFNALFQSCLVKRPFNLFHRKNLSIRTKRIDRTFGNKTTWEKPFELLFKKYAEEINELIFNSNSRCVAMCKSYNDIKPNDVDLIYLDPPYLNFDGKNETSDYFKIYHFLEGIMLYNDWANNINRETKNLRLINLKNNFFRKDIIYDVYDSMFEQFKEHKIVLSYKSDGIPSIQFLVNRLKKYGKHVEVKSIPYSYSLKKNHLDKKIREYLIVAL